MATANAQAMKVLEHLLQTGVGSSKVVEENKQGNVWYRVWNSGLIEQWGAMTGTNGVIKVTFLKPFSNSSYFFTSAPSNDDVTGNWFNWSVSEKTATGVSAELMGGDYNGANSQSWYACGY